MRRRIVILFLIAAIVCAAGWILWRRLVVAPLNFVEKKGEGTIATSMRPDRSCW